VLAFADKVAAVRGDSKARIRKELYASASKLPGDLEKGCNEVRLLHGTKPGALFCLTHYCFILFRPRALFAQKESLGAFASSFARLGCSSRQFQMQYITRMIMSMRILCNRVVLRGADLVRPIANQGMNERFAGSSKGTAFGDVSVFCLNPKP
jgi:hypothetical protein